MSQPPSGSGAVEPTLFSTLSESPEQMFHGVFPYPDAQTGRSSGWSGSETSRERAQRDDADGTTTERQARVLRLLVSAGRAGLTWQELSAATGWHHGRASGALSNLHEAGLIACLSGREERRQKCAPYVLPEHVNGREIREYGRDRPGLTRFEGEAYGRLRILAATTGPGHSEHARNTAADINAVLDAIDRLTDRPNRRSLPDDA